MKEIIKEYLENLAKKDTALADKYSEEKMDNCISYINKCASKQLNSKVGFIDDAVVFKWARDFYLGDTKNDEVVNSVHDVETKEKPETQKQEKAKFIDEDKQLDFAF